MVTSSSFGFISYNSHDYLKHVLELFVSDGIFSRCACWFHESLGTEKNHFHCWVEPARQLDTSKIGDRFVELTEEGDKQSIAIRPKCKSDWNNAYLYGIHDNSYLKYKGLRRELVNIKSDNHIYIGDFKEDIQQAEYFKFKTCLSPYERIMHLVVSGATLQDVYIELRTPFAQLRSVAYAYKNIRREIYERSDFDLLGNSTNKKNGSS
ncbi:MAG: hypothetical protein HDQ88_11705 [Clostridia bacterium]|nr:hypothetical protein [Clostridia bacterium]